MINVNAKKRRWGSEKAGDAYSHPARLKARRGGLKKPPHNNNTVFGVPPSLLYGLAFESYSFDFLKTFKIKIEVFSIIGLGKRTR